MTAAYHAFVDRSKRKPYICGICGRDIKHPYHQPPLEGTAPRWDATSEPQTIDAEPEHSAPEQFNLFQPSLF